MDSKDAEELRNNTDDTLALNKKRGRRVSFAAEITSVHVFDRDDEELETPPEPLPQPEPDPEVDVAGFFKDLEDDTDDGVGEDSRERSRTDDDMYGVGRQPFLQPFESPSSASDFASANSNDADDYFGPVSSEFIRPGRFSDSVASDDNHEITMDSTAFSMHFRSLAKSDSGYLKTPTSSPLVFEEKTPTQSGTTTVQESSMELTRLDKSFPYISIPVDKFSSGKDSDDMNLLEENPRKYDYAKISPRLDELMSVGSKFPGLATSEFSNGVNATTYIVNNSRSTSTQNGSNSPGDVPAADLGSLIASGTTSDRVREELLTSSHSIVQPSENKNQSSIQHNTATEISDDRDSKHVEAQMPGVRSGKLSEMSSPVPSFGQSTQTENSHFHSRADLLIQSKTTPKNNSSGQRCQSHSPVIPYPSSSVELSENSHGEGRCESDISHNIAMTYQSPSVAISSLVYDLKVQLGMDVSDTSRQPELIPSKKSESTSTGVKYLSVEKKLLGMKLNGVASLSRTPVAGDSSLRSKLCSCIKKTPQHDMPVSRLEDQFLGIDPGPSVQKMTDDMDDDAFTPSERLGRSLLCQEGVSTNLRSSSKSKNIRSVHRDGVSSLNVTPLVDGSSIRSKLSSCIVKTPQRGTLVSRLEQHFLSIDQEHSIQKRTADVDYSQVINTRDRKDVNSYHISTNPPALKTFYDNKDNNSDKTIEKIFSSENSSGFTSPPRTETILHLELNQRSPADRVIAVSPENGGLMETISSGSYLNVVAQKLDNMFAEQNLNSRSPVILIDQVRDPLQVHPLLSGDWSDMLQNTEFLRIPLRTEAILSSDGNADSSGGPFAPHAHASADESLMMVQAPTKESSLSGFEEYGMNLKASGSNVHKRGHDQIVTGDQHSAPNVDKPRSPKIPKNKINDCVKLNDGYNDAESRCRSIVAPKHWSAILSEALADSEQSCSTSFNKLDLQKIELLEDVLIQLQKVQNVTGICDSIQTQRVGGHNNMERNRRISETKELLQKMLLEQAKLKLLRVKREKLQERVEIVRFGIQRCQTMKLNCSRPLACVKCNAKSVRCECDPQSLTVQLEDQRNLQAASHDIPKMRQKVTAAQREIDALMYSFYTCFKMKEKCTNVDTITLVNDRLRRRALFKSLREDMQLWEISDMVHKNGQNKISLNYHGYLIQRYTLVAPTSTVTVSYVLNCLNIEKKYPNMEAHNAFSYVFKEDVEQKYVGIRSLARETQVTSSVLSSLLDVIEEVKLARLEFKHVNEAKFRSSPARKLDLCLHFVDFKTGMKLDITLDVSCLSCGVYPSDVFPSQVQPHSVLTNDSFPAGIQAALEKLKFGSSRILRICRCISNVLAIPRL